MISNDPHSCREMMAGRVGGPWAGGVGIGRGVEVGAGVNVGVLLGVGGTGLAVGGKGVEVDEGVGEGVHMGPCAVGDALEAVERVGVEAAT